MHIFLSVSLLEDVMIISFIKMSLSVYKQSLLLFTKASEAL